MPALSIAPALSFFNVFGRMSPARPFRTLIRTTGYKLRPPRPVRYEVRSRKAQERVLAGGKAEARQLATILYEARRGSVPTIVLGGFVPDATEQVFLLRGFLLRRGSVYYINYSREGFSNELLFAQLEDLVDDIAARHGQRPVIFSVSYGVGLVMEWLKRARQAGRKFDLRGLVLISPVACAEDLLDPASPKPTTLLGRAVKPYFESKSKDVEHSGIERSRAIFTKMFEAGAQNKETLGALMTRRELSVLKDAVIGTIQNITSVGACERVLAMKELAPPSAYFSQSHLPLSDAPTLILYAEKESSVLVDNSPTRFALETAHRAYFPQSHCRVVTNEGGTPVQHASLIFHCFNFLPSISAFYKHVKTGRAFRVK